MHILLLNGPPGSGKDQLGRFFQELAHCHLLKFAKVVKDSVHRIYGLNVEHDHFEKTKNDSRMEFFGKTPRQVYIAFSEAFMKPLHGKGIFGHFVLEEITKGDHGKELIVITDSGFVEEAEVLVNHFGHRMLTLIHMHREGCSFKNDSRNYIYLDGVSSVNFSNNNTLESLRQRASYMIDYMIETGLISDKVKR